MLFLDGERDHIRERLIKSQLIYLLSYAGLDQIGDCAPPCEAPRLKIAMFELFPLGRIPQATGCHQQQAECS